MNKTISEKISIGTSDIQVSQIGVGTNTWGVKGKAYSELKPVFEVALENGINFFDTAEIYSMGGSERTLGQLLGSTNQKVVIATKFFPAPWRLQKDSLIHALKSSLKRLQIPQVDLYMVHFPLPPVGIETWIDALAESVKSGLARTVGVSNYNPEQMARAHAALAKQGIPLACNQVEYNLLKRDVERSGLLALCHELKVTLIAYRPVAGGLLAGKYTLENPPTGLRSRFYSRQPVARILPAISLLRQVGEAHSGKTPSQVAINWLICKGTLPIPGASKVHSMQENSGALGWRLSEDEVALLEEAVDGDKQ